MTDLWPTMKGDFDAPWQKERRSTLIYDIDVRIDENTQAYQEVRRTIHWESPRLDRFVGKAQRLQNLRMALMTYASETLEKMEKGFEEL